MSGNKPELIDHMFYGVDCTALEFTRLSAMNVPVGGWNQSGIKFAISMIRKEATKATGSEAPKPEPVSQLDIQEGGSHYKSMAIQPVQYITANKIPFMEGSVIKYVSRHAAKNGAADIKKAIHFLNLILELNYGEKP